MSEPKENNNLLQIDSELFATMHRTNALSTGSALLRFVTEGSLPVSTLKHFNSIQFMPAVQKHPYTTFSKVIVAFKEGDHATVKELIQSGNFFEVHHEELRSIWKETILKEVEEKNGLPLNEVQRHRLFKKHPWPLSISDGDTVKYGIREKDRKILEQFYAFNPWPTHEEREQLAFQTNYTVEQVKCYFKNRRHRMNENEGDKGTVKLSDSEDMDVE